MDEADVAVCLREIAEKLFCPRVDHLSQKSQMVGATHHLFEVFPGLFYMACVDQVTNQPEAEYGECPLFFSLQTVSGLFGDVSTY